MPCDYLYVQSPVWGLGSSFMVDGTVCLIADSTKGQKPKATRKKTTSVSEKSQLAGLKPEETIQGGHSQMKPVQAGKVAIETEAVELSQPMDTGGIDVIDSMQETTSLAEVMSPMELEYAAQVEVTIEGASDVQVKMEPTKELPSASVSGMSASGSSAPFQPPSRIPAASAALSAKSSVALAKFLRSFLGKGVASFHDIRDALLLKQDGE